MENSPNLRTLVAQAGPDGGTENQDHEALAPRCEAVATATARIERTLLDRGLLPRHPRRFGFDRVQHAALRESAAAQLKCPQDKLNTLHTIDAARGSTPRRESKRFQGKNKDLDALHALCAGYERFIVEVVAPRVAAQWDARNVNCDTNSTDHRGNAAAAPPPLRRVVFQRQPCLRVSPPKPGPSGRRHRDRDYNHQPGQVNYWLPLAPAAGHNTLWVETVPDDVGGGGGTLMRGGGIDDMSTSAVHHTLSFSSPLAPAAPATAVDATDGAAADPKTTPLEGDFGECFEFYGNGAFHFTRANTSGSTRVSLDFRVVPGPLFEDDWIGSRNLMNGQQSFFLGDRGYYAVAVFSPATSKWQVVPTVGS